MPTSQEPSKEKKVKFLLHVYFGVSNVPDDDVNPYETPGELADNTVGSMDWGTGSTATRSKKRFAYNYCTILKTYKVILDRTMVEASLVDDQNNRAVVETWADQAEFI